MTSTNDRAELIDFINRNIEDATQKEADHKSHLSYGDHASFRYYQGRKHALQSVLDWLSNHLDGESTSAVAAGAAAAIMRGELVPDDEGTLHPAS